MKDRVRQNTPEKINTEIDTRLKESIVCYRDKAPAEISTRIEKLDREWDIERTLEINMSSIALSGVVLAAFHNRRWLLLPGIVLSFFAQHAIQGWCPPLPIFRKLGFRTRKEIDKEKFALKVLRGDFDEVAGAGSMKNTAAIVQAVS